MTKDLKVAVLVAPMRTPLIVKSSRSFSKLAATEMSLTILSLILLLSTEPFAFRLFVSDPSTCLTLLLLRTASVSPNRSLTRIERPPAPSLAPETPPAYEPITSSLCAATEAAPPIMSTLTLLSSALVLSVNLLTTTDPIMAILPEPAPPIAMFSISSLVLAATSRDCARMRLESTLSASRINEAFVVVEMRLTAMPIPSPSVSA